jgi:hypothetical protein
MLHEAYSIYTVSQMTIHEWFEHFKNGRNSMDDELSGQPLTSESKPLIAQVKILVMEIVD